MEEVAKYLNKRAPWISRQIKHFEKFQPLPPKRNYVSGETYYYLGRQYRLKIHKGNKPQVKLIGRFFQMELPDKNDNGKAKDLMLLWYKNHSKELFSRRIDIFMEYFQKLGARKPELKVRLMKSRWGSCSTKNIITLNTELVKAPLYCIDYVVVHELCHLLHPKHNNGFYKTLRRILPDWEQRKERLEKAML
jgi:hypothetical protein